MIDLKAKLVNFTINIKVHLSYLQMIKVLDENLIK